MKNLKILGGLIIAYALNSCSLTPEPDPTLPPETQTGANTFGCLINGKVFVPKGNSKYDAITKNYDGRLAIFTLYTQNGTIESSVGILIDSCNKEGEYNLKLPKSLWYKGQYGWQSSPLKGKAFITKYQRGEDLANNLRWLTIAGTFEGVLLNDRDPLDTIKITQGRFDVKFQ